MFRQLRARPVLGQNSECLAVCVGSEDEFCQGNAELKVELTRDQLQRMRWHPALGDLAAGEPVTRNLRSIYFDTPDHRLRALGISLRLRSEGRAGCRP